MLVVGLGNPGLKYRLTKHNFGFWVLDKLVEKSSLKWQSGYGDYIYAKQKDLNAEIITPVFKDEKNGTLKIISFYAKKARGMMTRFIIQNRIKNIDEIKNIRYLESFKSFNASRPSISLMLGLSLVAFGGVLGKLKLNKPSATETTAAR